MPKTSILFYPGEFAEARQPGGHREWLTVKIVNRCPDSGGYYVEWVSSCSPFTWWANADDVRPYGAGTGQPQTRAVPAWPPPVPFTSEFLTSIERTQYVLNCRLIADGDMTPVEPKEANSIYDSMLQAVSRLRRDYNRQRADLELLEAELKVNPNPPAEAFREGQIVEAIPTIGSRGFQVGILVSYRRENAIGPWRFVDFGNVQTDVYEKDIRNLSPRPTPSTTGQWENFSAGGVRIATIEPNGLPGLPLAWRKFRAVGMRLREAQDGSRATWLEYSTEDGHIVDERFAILDMDRERGTRGPGEESK